MGIDADDALSTTRAGMGLTVFRESCLLASPLPVFALGGVTVSNAHQCVEAGAVGVAAIRLFMGKDAGWRVLAQKHPPAKSEP